MFRVCHVQVFPILSGVQRVMLDLFDQLDRREYELHVICKEPGPLGEELRRRGIETHFVRELDRPIHPWRDWRAYRRLRRIFAEQAFDLVHTHSSKPGVLGRLAARYAGVEHVIHHVHAFAFHEFSPPWKRRLYSRLERLAGRACDRVVFVNHEDRLTAIEEGILPAEKCVTVYNGVVTSADPSSGSWRREIRDKLGLASDEVAILFTGRLAPPKLPLLLPRIAASLRKMELNTKWRIVVVGSGLLQRRMLRRCRQLQVEDLVQHVGWQTDVAPWLAAADIFLFPTLAEGMPMALIEAQAAGLPAVASDARGNREVIAVGGGTLCPPGDPAAYAAALERLIADPSLRASLGGAGRDGTATYFDRNTNMGKIVALYEELRRARSSPIWRRTAA